MKEKVVNSLKELKNNVDKFCGITPLYIDVVSVELVARKNYTVYWFGPDKYFLDKYSSLIDQYFNDDGSRISLLFLKGSARTALHLFLYPLNTTENDTQVDFSSSIIKQIPLDLPGKEISGADTQAHIDMWTQQVLQKTNSVFVTFSKIDFTIANTGYSAAIWIGFGKKSDIESNPEKKIFYETLIEKFLWEHSLTTIASEQQQQMIMHATRAAISQVMARNMSHNIGSHVLSHYKNYPQDLIELLNQDEIGYFFDKKSHNKNFSVRKQYKAEGLGLSNNGKYNLENILYFNDYLKSRMDFLADIATTDPSMENPMYFVREVMSGIDKNRILLDRISGIENIKFDFHIRIFKESNSKWMPIQGNDSADDPIISISNDILGCQAFYIILENIIRNVAKHSKEDFKNFDIVIDFRDYKNNEDYFEVNIYDNLKKNKDSMDELVIKRNETFNTSILNQNNQVRSGNLGTIEMETCAAYLRMLPLATIEDRFYDITEDKYNIRERDNVKIPVLIYAYTHEHDLKEEKRYSLGYQLYLRKPQTVLIVDDSNTLKFSDADKKELRKNGIWIEKNESLASTKCLYGHQFLLWLNDKLDEELISGEHGRLPKRLLLKDDFNNEVLLKVNEPQNFIKKCWEYYGKKLITKNKKNGIKFLYKNNSSLFVINNSFNDMTNVYIDDHGEKWDSLEAKSCDYYELIRSHHRLYYFIEKERLKADYPFYQAEYAEVVLSKIIVIDERIQKNIANKEHQGSMEAKILFKELFDKQNIFIPTAAEIDLNVPNFGILSNENSKENGKSISDKIKNYIHNKIDYCDYCIIHLGILEKMLGVNVNKTEEEINTLVKVLFKTEDQRKKIIITSGRGKPHNIPKDLSFLSVAIVQNAIETMFDKFLLVKLLYNSRKTL